MDTVILTSTRKVSKKWREKIQNLIYRKNVCGVCLSENDHLTDWDAIYQTELEKKNRTLKDIIEFTFGCNLQNLLPSTCFCEKCITTILQSYLMMRKVRSNHRILEKYLKIIDEQITVGSENKSSVQKELMLTIDNVKSLNVPTTITVTKKNNMNNMTQIFLCAVDEETESESVEWNIENKNVLKYECPYCDKQYQGYIEFKNHYSQHKEVFFRCHKCSKRFKFFEDLVKHRNNIHADNLFTCNICKIILLSDQSKDHEQEHLESLICVICQIQFTTEKDLEKHLEDQHRDIPCPHCSKYFISELKLKNHRCLFNCLECEDGCIHEKYLASYRKQHMANMIIFQCCDCDFRYTTRSQLIAHVNEEHLQHFPYLCHLCGQNFSSRPLLTNHMNRKHADAYVPQDYNDKLQTNSLKPTIEGAYECNFCGFCFFTEEDYRIHRKRHLNGETECQLCKKIFYNIGRLNMHIANDHPEVVTRNKSLFKCSMCPLDFEFRPDYLKHVSTHPKGSNHICRECNVSYISKKSYICHIRKHKIKYDRECPICFKMYTLQTIQRHMKGHIKEKGIENRIPKPCDLCGALFMSDKAFLKHSKNHKGEKQCTHCGKFVKCAFYSKHLSLHEDKEKCMKTCPNCNYTTKYSSCLEAHVNRHHLKVRPYKCQVCSKTFYSEYTLKGHLIVHRDERQEHYCHICGKKFISKKALMLHTRIHTGETPYPCEFCELSFLSASRRRTHMIRKHFEPSFECPNCHKKLFTQSDLRRHTRQCHDLGSKRKRSKKAEDLVQDQIEVEETVGNET